jgi:hypothetical protein
MRDSTVDVTVEALIRETEAKLLLYRAWKPSVAAPAQRKRGRPQSKADYHLKIAVAVARLVEGSPLKATRSHVKRRLSSPSACSIVQAALARLGENISERSVEDIWRRHEHLFISKHRPY